MNVSRNSTPDCKLAATLQRPLVVLNLFFVAVAFLEFVFVTLVIRRHRSLQTNCNILLISLTGSDTLMSLTYGLSQFPDEINNSLAISLLLGAGIGTIMISLMHTAAIAVDRYIFIVYPFVYLKHVTKRIIYRTTAVIWLLGLVYAIAPVLAYRQSGSQLFCIFQNPPEIYFWLATSIYMAVIIVIFLCYLRIACLAFQHKKAWYTRKMNLTTIEDNNNLVLLRKHSSAAFRSVKFFAIMFGILTFCTGPAMLVCGIQMLIPVPRYIPVSLLFLFLVNALANVVIYAVMNRELSKACRDTLTEMKTFLCGKPWSSSS